MRKTEGFPAWFSQQKLGTILAIGCGGPIALCCLCGLPNSILTPVPESPKVSEVAQVETLTGQAAAETPFAENTQAAPTPTQSLTPSLEPTVADGGGQLAALSSLGISCVPETTQRDQGLVVGIVDGDTIDISMDGQIFRIRYIGIDTPEKNDNFFEEATARNQELVDNQNVLLVKDVSETDRFGRILRYVIVGNTFVNYELVRQGYAMASSYPPDVACSDLFASTQNQAQSDAIGFWASALIIPMATIGNDNNRGNCDPAYPTVCIAPPPPDLDCKDVSYRRFKVLPPDPHRFDGDDDGIGCES